MLTVFILYMYIKNGFIDAKIDKYPYLARMWFSINSYLPLVYILSNFRLQNQVIIVVWWSFEEIVVGSV